MILQYNGVLGIICDLLYAQGQKKQGRNERKSIMEEKKQQKEEEKLIAAIKVCTMHAPVLCSVMVLICCSLEVFAYKMIP